MTEFGYFLSSEELSPAELLIRELWKDETVTHRGEYYTVDAARIFSLPEQLPPILVSGFGPDAADVAARIADGWVSVQPDGDLLKRYRDRAGKGVTQGGTKICWAASADDAARTAYRLWGFQGVGGQSSQDLPSWVEFEQLAEANSPDQVAETVPCGPDPERAAEAIKQYVDAGFDEVYISQMGPGQQGGIRFLTDEVLPRVRGDR